MDILTMEPTSFSSGIPVSYRVKGLSEAQTVEIFLKEHRFTEVWKVRFGGRGRLTGSYDSPEAALLALQTGKLSVAGA